MGMLRVHDGVETAYATILASRRSGEVVLPDAVRARVQAVFGADLTAEEVVARVISDVRADGDDALRHYGEALDGAAIDRFRVDEALIDAAMASAPAELRKL
jgi:histidinol dehydrogenase